MAKISDEPFGDFKPKSATGPAGASRFELPSFTKGISPQLLIDNAKSQGIITGAGGQADQLCHMIENENQRLLTKKQQITD